MKRFLVLLVLGLTLVACSHKPRVVVKPKAVAKPLLMLDSKTGKYCEIQVDYSGRIIIDRTKCHEP